MASPAPNKGTKSPFILPEQICQRLTLAEIKLATNNFDDSLVIGRGGFGKVYKSLNQFGSVNEVAIKRLHSTSSQGAHEFEAEVRLLSKLHHANLVPLIGYCCEGNEMILAYEFMPNGTLEDQLHGSFTELSWLQRLKICVGAARGLDYLHAGTSTQQGVIHRDVKTSNILLDSNLEAKISDFGLAKVGTKNQMGTYHVSTLVKGTFGYMDPSYFQSGKLTRKSDVYAFGVVLFEVLTGKQALDPTFDEDLPSLAVWAQDHVKRGRLNDIVNHRMMAQISKRCLKEFASLAVNCLHDQPKQRPTMAEVVVKLESMLTLERERIGSGVDDGTFINKVRHFFTGKADNRSLRIFTYAELASATNDFTMSESTIYPDEYIYKGWVDALTYAPTKSSVGLAVCVKIVYTATSKPHLRAEEFNHPNLVRLLGYNLNEQNLSCVYELLPSLDTLLYEGSLSWVARLKIGVGAAQGLSLLHKKGHLAYKQFKTACILVDTDYSARLRDFEVDDSSLKFGRHLFNMGVEYSAPEWVEYQGDMMVDGISNVKYPENGFGVISEIYSFGVVLLEMLTGMKVFDQNRPVGKHYLVKWATPWLANEESLGMILDRQLQDSDHPPKGAFMLAQLVSKCLQSEQDERPSMEEIFRVLRQCYREASFDS